MDAPAPIVCDNCGNEHNDYLYQCPVCGYRRDEETLREYRVRVGIKDDG